MLCPCSGKNISTHHYRANGFAVFRSCSSHSERKLVVRFALNPMRGNQTFRCRLVNIGLNSKRVKVVLWPENSSVGSYFLLRIPDHKGGPGNPSAPIGINAFRTTNFRS